MDWFDKYNITELEFINVCKSSRSMRHACTELGLHFNTFRRQAIKIGCYDTNQSGKGVSKYRPNTIKLDDVLNGQYPHYKTGNLKRQLMKYGLKSNQCELCKITEWNGNSIVMELDHIDGNRFNHSLDNLKMLCPNCHSQTPTFRGRNIKSVNGVRELPKAPTKPRKPKRAPRQCIDCNNEITYKGKTGKCTSCVQKSETKPSVEQLSIDLKSLPMTKIGEKYGVSDNAVRKWLRSYELPVKYSDIQRWKSE